MMRRYQLHLLGWIVFTLFSLGILSWSLYRLLSK